MNGYEYFKLKIEEEYGSSIANSILESIKKERKTTFRINTLKGSVIDIYNELKDLGFNLEKVDFYDSAFTLNNKSLLELEETSVYKEGKIYVQSLSSMIPPLMLNPKENHDILDMAAAPGGKTTELATLTNNKARITACEMNKIRAERLSFNVKLQGASSVYVLNQDSRRLDSFFSFDEILLDAPCSGSGTRCKTHEFDGLTQTLVEKSTKSQIALLRKALDHLKKGGCLVYSTCSIFKEENEDIVNKAISGTNITVEELKLESKDLVLLPTKIKGAITIAPNESFEGFFVVKLKKG